MKRFFITGISLVPIVALGLGCAPEILLPPIQEPLDSRQWRNCAEEGEKRESMSLIDDMTLDSKTMLCRAVVLASEGETEKSVELLNEAAVNDKADHRPYFLQGRILTEAGRFEEALTAFERSRSRFEEITVPTESLGRKVQERDGDEEARGFLEKAMGRGLCNYGCKGLLATLCHRTGDDSRAEALFQEMIRENPSEPAGYVGLASLHNTRQEYLEESELLTKAVESSGFALLPDADKARIHYSHAFSRYNAMKLKGAVKSIDRALKLEQRGDWWLLSGWIQMKLKDPAMGLVKFEKALEQNEKLSAAHVGRGDALMALGRNAEAVEAYQKGAYLDPVSAVNKLKLAHALGKSGNKEKARSLLDEAVRMDKDHLPSDLLKQVTDLLPAENNE